LLDNPNIRVQWDSQGYYYAIGGVYMKLNVGDVAPDFILESHMEQKIQLNELSRSGKITVLAFFPKAWTPI